MSTRLLSPSVLMDMSESRLATLRLSGTDDERRVIARIFDQPSAYRRWGAYHYPLMKRVAGTGNRRDQRVRLRQTNFLLLHRQALFEYLRESRVGGRDREALFAAFYSQTDYTRAVLTEHGRYVESNTSLYCTDHLEQEVMRDADFTAGFADYRQQYMQYFSLYCNWVIADSRGLEYPMHMIVREMKQQLSRSASRLLALPEPRSSRRPDSRPWSARWRAALATTT